MTEEQVTAGAERLVMLGQEIGNRFIQSHARHLARQVLEAAETAAPDRESGAGSTTGPLTGPRRA